jgi:hypothetical protein
MHFKTKACSSDRLWSPCTSLCFHTPRVCRRIAHPLLCFNFLCGLSAIRWCILYVVVFHEHRMYSGLHLTSRCVLGYCDYHSLLHLVHVGLRWLLGTASGVTVRCTG